MNTLTATEKMVPLAPFTTLELGGPASQLVRITSVAQALDVIEWWRGLQSTERPRLLPLGGGSNLLVCDGGFEGLVLKMENQEWSTQENPQGDILVRVGAGLIWDDFVARTCREGWAGVECLSGIPGCVGASPVQNIGAYGQEVSETIHQVEVIDTTTARSQVFSNSECEFSYRDSFFKRAERGRYLITAVTFRLRPGGDATIKYRDLKERVEELQDKSLTAVRELVLAVRRSKSMVYDKTDPNHRSAGSFFTNPIVSSETADRIQQSFGADIRFPRFPVSQGKEKLSAAWLIDNAGLKKGFRHKPDARVGLSSNHVLALTNRGGASATELLELCRHVQDVVEQRFGIRLVPEPVFVGF